MSLWNPPALVFNPSGNAAYYHTLCFYLPGSAMQKRPNRSRSCLGEDPHWPKEMHALDGVHTGATWRIRLNDARSAAMRAVATITVATCFTLSSVAQSRQILPTVRGRRRCVL